jgi:hypothetical protein
MEATKMGLSYPAVRSSLRTHRNLETWSEIIPLACMMRFVPLGRSDVSAVGTLTIFILGPL